MARSFEAFYEQQFAPTFRAAYAASGDRELAADATQEAFKRALVHWRRVRNHPSPEGWVMTTALNVIKKELRSQNRLPRSAAPSPQAHSEHTDRVGVAQALSELPSRQQQATVLYYIGDLPIALIAESMSISEGAVKAHLAQARATLQKALEVRHG